MTWEYVCTACGKEWEFKCKIHGSTRPNEDVRCTCGGPLLHKRIYDEHKVGA